MPFQKAFARREGSRKKQRDVAIYGDRSCTALLHRFPPGVFQPRRCVRFMLIRDASFEVQWLADAATPQQGPPP